MDNVKLRIKAAWQVDNRTEAYGLMADELRDFVVKTLVRQYGYGPRGLTSEEAEEAYDDALQAFLSIPPTNVFDPGNYIFKSAFNNAKDELARKGRQVPLADEGELDRLTTNDAQGTRSHGNGPDSEISSSNEDGQDLPMAYRDSAEPAADRENAGVADLNGRAVSLAEALTEQDLASRPGLVARVVRAAIQQLPPRCQKMAWVLLEHEPATSNAVLTDLLQGTSESTTRALKLRTLRHLKRLIPEVAADLGYQLSDLGVKDDEQLFLKSEPIPTPDNTEEGGDA